MGRQSHARCQKSSTEWISKPYFLNRHNICPSGTSLFTIERQKEARLGLSYFAEIEFGKNLDTRHWQLVSKTVPRSEKAEQRREIKRTIISQKKLVFELFRSPVTGRIELIFY
jgi:hypothetical protein